jgi:hypothetical protein
MPGNSTIGTGVRPEIGDLRGHPHLRQLATQRLATLTDALM